MKNVCILGSTGSIGKAAIEVIHHLKDKFRIIALSCHENISLFEQQVESLAPKYACITNPDSAGKFWTTKGTTILTGVNGLCELVTYPDINIVLNGLVGTVGIRPTLEAIRAGKRIAMANKETLIVYGESLMQEVLKNNTVFLPVDSEHSAIHQCISQSFAPINRIILTASGGPFLNSPVTGDTSYIEALKHPVWEMGKKITIDSATLMNKGLEVIEASCLFNLPASNIKVVIHPQSIIHSAVEFVDGSILAQLSSPDMRLPIQYALTYPERYPSLVTPLDLPKIKRLEFAKPDFNKFPCLRLAYESAYQGGTMPCVLNAANDVAVKALFAEKIKFTEIPKIIEKVMRKHTPLKAPCLTDIEETERWATAEAEKEIKWS